MLGLTLFLGKRVSKAKMKDSIIHQKVFTEGGCIECPRLRARHWGTKAEECP